MTDPTQTLLASGDGSMQAIRRSVAEFLSRPGTQALVVLAVLLGVLLQSKWSLASHQVIKGGDGGYYTNVAMHIQNGEGLKTNLSLMHKGYDHFPHPTAVYPLWPLVQGYAARVIGLHTAGVWLPTLFYFGTLIAAYLWATAFFPEPLFPRMVPGLNAGHVMVAMFGLNKEFYWFTSLPYTEGLAYMLLFIGLCRANRVLRSPSILGGCEVGLWSGLAFLARTQLVIFHVALLVVLFWGIAAVPPRRIASVKVAAASTAVFALLTTPYYIHVKSFALSANFLTLLRFDQVRATDVLTPIDPLVRTNGLWDYMVDRLSGVPIAFNLTGEYAYAQQFFTFQYALLAAVPVFLVWLVRRLDRAHARALWAWLRSTEAMPGLFAAIFTVGGLLSIHLMHKALWSEWNFHIRHALTCSFAFFFALVFLLRGRSLTLAAGLVVLCTGVYAGHVAAHDMVSRAERRSNAEEFRPGLVDWINQRRRAEGELILASRFVQHIWHYTPGVSYHSYFDDTSLADMLKMFDELGVDYLVVPVTVQPRFMRDRSGFVENFDFLAVKDDCRIFGRRHPGAPMTGIP